MSNIVNIEDFRERSTGLGLSVETKFFKHTSANTNTPEYMGREEELMSLIHDINSVLNIYFDQMHNISSIDELIDSLQRVFVFVNKEIKYN